MARFRSMLVGRLSAWRARAFQWLDGRGVSSSLARWFPTQLLRPPPRQVDPAAALDTDLGRPIRCPQRRRGRLLIRDLPPVDSPRFARLVAAARRRNDVVVDVDRGDVEAARALRILAASGAVVRVPSGARLPVGLGAELRRRLVEPPAETPGDVEIRSIRTRRAALSELWLDEPGPRVSVVLASHRPDDIEAAVEQIGRQIGVRAQVVVGLHGDGWPDAADELVDRLPTGSEVLRFDGSMTLGAVLNELVARSDAELVAKWDDDDWYGPHHLLDLVLAHRYSGADVVGKAAEFVRLESLDLTIRRFAYGAESYTTTVAGGAMLTSRAWLDRIGGWTDVATGVDRALLERTTAEGGHTYRTHGHEYVLRRRSDRQHTWDAPDELFEVRAVVRRSGLDLALADIHRERAGGGGLSSPSSAGSRVGDERSVVGSQWDLIADVIPDDEAIQVDEQYFIDRIIGPLHDGAFVVDLGCGEGRGRGRVLRVNPRVRWLGVDLPSSPEVDGRTSTPRDVVSFDGIELPLRSASVDCVMSNQVLEHVRHPEPLLREVARVLKPGGRFFGTTSNLEPYHSYSLWNFTPYGFVTIARDAGLEVLELRPGIDGPTLIERQILGRPKEMSKYFGSTSPRNEEFIAWGHRSRRRAALVNNRMLQFCGHFGFIAERPAG